MDGILISDILKFSWGTVPPDTSRNGDSLCMVLTGSKGMGKSWTLRQVEHAFANVYNREYSVRRAAKGTESALFYKVHSLDSYTLSTQMNQLRRDVTPTREFHTCHVVVLDDVAKHSQILDAQGKLRNLVSLCKSLRKSAPTQSVVLLVTGENELDIPSWITTLYPSPLVHKLESRGLSDRLSLGSKIRNPRTFGLRSQLERGTTGFRTPVATDFLSEFDRRTSPEGLELENQVTLLGYADYRQRLQMLMEVFVEQQRDSRYAPSQQLGHVARSVKASTGILLHGPSGCGKSAMVREACLRLSERVVQSSSLTTKVSFQFVNAPRIFSKYLGESEANLRSIFARARATRPSILVVDDIDMLAAARSNNESSAGSTGGLDVSVRVLSALLCEMDGVEDTSGVLVVGTTNRLHAVDKALLRQGRLETVMEIPLPRDHDKSEMICHFLSKWEDTTDSVKAQVQEHLAVTLGTTSSPKETTVSSFWGGAKQNTAWTSSRVELLFRNIVELGLQDDEGNPGHLPELSLQLVQRGLDMSQ